MVFPDAASEEALAAITAGGTIVFTCSSVSTYGTQTACSQVARGVHVSAFSWWGVWHERERKGKKGSSGQQAFRWLALNHRNKMTWNSKKRLFIFFKYDFISNHMPDSKLELPGWFNSRRERPKWRHSSAPLTADQKQPSRELQGSVSSLSSSDSVNRAQLM